MAIKLSETDSKNEKTGSPLWHKALERYRQELEENDGSQDVLRVKSLDDLLQEAETIESAIRQDQTVITSMTRLGSRLKFIDDFSAVIALYFGVDVTLTALVWGSIRLMLTLASPTGNALQDVLDMLEELSLILPRVKTLPMDGVHENALLDVYIEVIRFYARAIHLLRKYPHVLQRQGAWEDFRSDFGQTVRHVKRMYSTVETKADLARMQVEETKYREGLDPMRVLERSNLQDQSLLRCHHIPSEWNPRFWGRERALLAMEDALEPKGTSTSQRSFALYGKGGVGKTQIALKYANRHRDQYRVILWIATDTTRSVRQSFKDIARRLELVESDTENQGDVAAMEKVKGWLTEAPGKWLLILDNADDPEILRQAWPGNAYGTVLLTCRNMNLAYSSAQARYHVQPFDDITGSDVLLQLVGLDTKQVPNQERARAITHALGGLPLALNQIGGFIRQRKLPLEDFIPLYERNSAKIDSRKTGLGDYEHTLSTVWGISILRLTADARTLINLLSFFQPDGIHEVLVVEGLKSLENDEFYFLQDEMK